MKGDAHRSAGAYGAIWRNRSLLFLNIGRALRSFSQSYLSVMVPLYLMLRGSSVTQVGVLLTVWAAGSALLAVIAGFVADRYGRKLVLYSLSTLTMISAFVFYLDSPLWVLAIAGALGTIGRGGGPASGGGFGPFYSAEQALIAEQAQPRIRNRIFAVFSLVGALAGAAGFTLTAIPQLLAYWHLGNPLFGYRIVFLVTAVIGVLLFISIVPIREVAAGTHPYPCRDRRIRVAPLSASTRAAIWRFAITNATNGLAVGFLGPMLVLWFHLRYGASAQEIGAVYFVIALASSLSYIFVGRIVEVVGGAVRTVVFLRIGSSVLLAILPLMPTLWLAGAMYLIRVLLNSATVPVRQSYIMGIVAPAERARAASLSNLPSQFFSMAGPSIAGVLLHDFWIGTMLELASALQLVNAGLYWMFFRNRPPPEELMVGRALQCGRDD